MDELWYKNVAYEDAKELVKENLVSTVASFIASGYWLKYIRDSREYEKDGYQSLWDFAEKEFGLKISEASRAMSMNDKYSIDGNTPMMLESYKSYTKSQLQEMLTMSDEQIEQVTPDMTIKDIREIKNPKVEGLEESIEKFKNYIHDFVRLNYVKLNHEFSEAAGISIERLNEMYFNDMFETEIGSCFILMTGDEAELVDKITGEIVEKCDSNTVITIIADKFAELRESKQLCDVAKDSVDTECEDESTEDIYTEIEVTPEEEETLNVEFNTDELLQKLDNEDVIDTECREVKETVEDEEEVEEVVAAEQPQNDLYKIKQLLERKKDELAQFLDCEDIPEDTIFEKKTIVAALANMVCKLEESEYWNQMEQPKLPDFKNNNQREAWLENVEAWGLWYEDSNIQARYYKYDFPDGSRLIAVKYRYTCPPWMREDVAYVKEYDGSYKNTYYHMIFSEEYKEKHEYVYENYYENYTVSISKLVEFIKEIAKERRK
ncbi:MAG: hypothetical protein NC118_10930 [Eubacterium sp.]|nr:hypothetical protein [Eubacterium sp.]